MTDKSKLIKYVLCTILNIIGIGMTTFVPKPADFKALLEFLKTDPDTYLSTFLIIIAAIIFSVYCVYKLVLEIKKLYFDGNFEYSDDISIPIKVLSVVFIIISVICIINFVVYFVLLSIVPVVIFAIIYFIFKKD